MRAPPRIALNLLYLAPGATGGTEVYARELVPRLPEEWPEAQWAVLCGDEFADELGTRPWAGVEVVRLPVSSETRARRVLAEQTLAPLALRRIGADLVHSLAVTTPLVGGPPAVITIHDLIYKVVPETHRGVLAHGLAALTPLSARRARRVIAISDATRRDLVERLGVPEEKIDVVPQGPGSPPVGEATSEPELRRRLGLGDAPVLLAPSAKRPHKNLERLIEAVARVPGTPVLVIPGYPTPHEQRLQACAQTAGIADRVRLCGWVDGADFEGLYALATALVFPSLVEGFGLPVLEAMSRGVPVACSQGGALEEVAGDAALLFDPRDVGSIAGALGRMLAEPGLRAELAARGRRRAEDFSWRHTAELTAATYRRALGLEDSGPS